MADSHEVRLRRARIALEGLSVADSFGGFFELASWEQMTKRLKEKRLPPKPWHFTDDTNMALSIFSTLRQYGEIHQDQLAKNFAEHFDRSRGYGLGARHLLMQMRNGNPWRELTREMFGGTGSYGNGSAMRVAPLGAYFADDLNTVVENARLSSEITHSHPEGVAGAIAIGVAAAFAWQLRGTQITRHIFIDQILPHVPESEVKQGIRVAQEIPVDTPIWPNVVSKIGNGSGISAQDTVPFVLWCAGESLSDYEPAIWLTASGGGDVDTTCAMVGGIVASYTGIEGIPKEWIENREPLPAWAFEEKSS
jgi:ADP-ribosylglycohydrolase